RKIKPEGKHVCTLRFKRQPFLSRQHLPELDVTAWILPRCPLEGQHSSVWRQRDEPSACRQSPGPKLPTAGYVPNMRAAWLLLVTAVIHKQLPAIRRENDAVRKS